MLPTPHLQKLLNDVSLLNINIKINFDMISISISSSYFLLKLLHTKLKFLHCFDYLLIGRRISISISISLLQVVGSAAHGRPC